MKCHVCNPYMVYILRGFIELYLAKNLKVFIEFMHEKYHTLLGLNITTLIVPYTCGKH